MLTNEKQFKSVCDKLLSYVKAEDAKVTVSSNRSSHLRCANNLLATSGQREDVGITVTVWTAKRKGLAGTNQMDDASLRDVVDQADQYARVSPIDREYLPTIGPQKYAPVGGYVERTGNFSPYERARGIHSVIAECRKNKVLGAGFIHTRVSASASATKNGNYYYHRSSLVSFSLTTRTSEGNGSGYFLRDHFDIAKVDISRIARESIRKALASRDPKLLDPGVYTVILESQAVADLLGFIASAFDARSADEGRSAFSMPGAKTKVGEKIFDERINLYSNPWNPELPAGWDGIAPQKIYLVRNGVLETLIYSRFWAQQKHKEPTPGPVNTIMESSVAPVSVDEMVRDTKRGLLVSRFWYVRLVDGRTMLVTGLTRDGIWYIENGKVQYPVRNFRFNQSHLQLLAPGNVEAIGVAERVGSSEAQGGAPVLMPALKIKEFHFTSLSEAV